MERHDAPQKRFRQKRFISQKLSVRTTESKVSLRNHAFFYKKNGSGIHYFYSLRVIIYDQFIPTVFEIALSLEQKHTTNFVCCQLPNKVSISGFQHQGHSILGCSVAHHLIAQ
jgi:hypothetical protein